MRKSTFFSFQAHFKTPNSEMLTSAASPESWQPGPGSVRRVLTWPGSRAGVRWAQETWWCPGLAYRPRRLLPGIPRLPRYIPETWLKKVELEWPPQENWTTNQNRPRRVLSPGRPPPGYLPPAGETLLDRRLRVGAPRRIFGRHFHRQTDTEAVRRVRYCWGTTELPVSF